eukprot:9972072-Lingulodinium_polyedra.AAC.1
MALDVHDLQLLPILKRLAEHVRCHASDARVAHERLDTHGLESRSSPCQNGVVDEVQRVALRGR